MLRHQRWLQSLSLQASPSDSSPYTDNAVNLREIIISQAKNLLLDYILIEEYRINVILSEGKAVVEPKLVPIL